jgi:hypothetical protein
MEPRFHAEQSGQDLTAGIHLVYLYMNQQANLSHLSSLTIS